MTHGWIVKVRRYGGGTSVVSHRFDELHKAQMEADRKNEEYQTDAYYVEMYDPMKAGWR